MSRDTRWRHQSKTLHIYVVCTSIIVCTNFEAITENFATDISWKFIFDIFKPAARGRSNIAWRPPVTFLKSPPMQDSNTVESNSKYFTNFKLWATSGFDRKEGSRDFAVTINIKTYINSISSHKKKGMVSHDFFFYRFPKIKIINVWLPVIWHSMT